MLEEFAYLGEEKAREVVITNTNRIADRIEAISPIHPDKCPPTIPHAEEDLEEITSPVVRRAVSQTVKVVNAIIRERGASPVYINIELAREMAKDFSERNKIKKENDANRVRNELLMKQICEEFGKRDATGQDLLKQKLLAKAPNA